MGWTGVYVDRCPTGKDRIQMAVHQEGYSFDEGYRKSEIVDSAIVGSTVYLAVHFINTDAGVDETYGAVVLTSYDKHRQEFFTKGMSDTMGPYAYDCPKRLLDKLSPTEDTYANQWRKMCETVRKKKTEDRKDALATMEKGKIKINGREGTWTPFSLHGRKVFVNWEINKYMTMARIRQVGYEICK